VVIKDILKLLLMTFQDIIMFILLTLKMNCLISLKFLMQKLKFDLKKKIKILQFDKCGEYASNEINEFLELYGIIHQVTPPCSPQSNEIVERKK
jgi:transposase InsO family protein